MTGWREVKLGEIATLSNGSNFTKESFGSGLKILGVRDFGDRTAPDWSAMDEVDSTAVSNQRQMLAEGDLVFVRSNGNPALVGRSMLITPGPIATHSAFTIKARPNRDLVEPRFLAYQMRHAHRVGLMAAANGTNITNLSQPILASVPVFLPDRATQRLVQTVLGSIDDLIAVSRRRVEVLEELARAVYREWFVHFRYPGHENATLVDSSLGPVPMGWAVSTCGDELTSLGGGTPSKSEPTYWEDGTVRWYTPSDLTKSRCRYTVEPELRITEAGLAKSSARLFPAGSILMTSRATLGVLAIATTKATTNQGFIVIPPDDRWSPAFVLHWLDEHAVELASIATGATFKEITKGAFKRVPFLVPSQDVLDAHTVATEPIEQEIRNLERQVRTLTSLRDLLLPKLVTGQIDVSAMRLGALVEDSVA
jgi:type I restriction enzyme S subunit